MLKHLVVVAMAAAGFSGAASAQTLAKLTLTETLRLDANDEDFPVVSGAIFGPRGMIAVMLAADAQIRLYDSTGKRIASVGRRGAGPGEFQRMLRYGWVGDTVWVYDDSHRRFTMISAAGRVGRTMPLTPSLNAGMLPSAGTLTTGVFSYVPNALLPDGSSLGMGSLITGRNAQGQVQTDGWIIRARATGEHDGIVSRPSYKSADVQRGGSSWGWGIPLVFQPQFVFARDGSRVAQLTLQTDDAGNGAYAILVVSSRGDTLLRRAYPYTGEKIPARVRDSAIAATSARNGRGIPPDVASELTAQITAGVPLTYPPVSTIYLGSDGTVWITKRRSAEGVPVVVHNSKGDPIAAFTLPPRSRLVDVNLREVLMSETDDDGLTSIVRYRVSGRTCGPPECR